MTAPDGLTGYETQMPFVHDGLTPAECDTCQREMAAACDTCHDSHGGAAGSFRAEGCMLCPPDDDSDALTTSPANDPLTALLGAVRFGVRALAYPLNATERRHLADSLTEALAAYE